MTKYFAILVSVVLIGCVPAPKPVAVVPVATGGNQAEGSVEMSYDLRSGAIKPTVNWDAAQLTAVSRCVAWGFTDAWAYENDTNICVSNDANSNCLETRISRTYQCTGS